MKGVDCGGVECMKSGTLRFSGHVIRMSVAQKGGNSKENIRSLLILRKK